MEGHVHLTWMAWSSFVISYRMAILVSPYRQRNTCVSSCILRQLMRFGSLFHSIHVLTGSGSVWLVLQQIQIYMHKSVFCFDGCPSVLHTS